MKSKFFRIIPFSVACLILLYSCSNAAKLPPINIQSASPDQPQTQVSRFPDTVNVVTRNGVFQLQYDRLQFVLVSKFRTTGISGSAANNSGIFLFKAGRLIALDHSLKLKKTVKFKKIDSIAANQNNVFISADGQFISLDNDLNILGKVELKCHEEVKNAHDILLYHHTAYLLDNVVYPIFVFKVSIANPSAPAISGKVEFMGINPHLDTQWLNPEKGQWNIVESFSVLGGDGQLVHSFPMSGGEKENFQQMLYERLRTTKQETSGIKFYSVTGFPPVWALIRNKSDFMELAQVKTADNKFTFARYNFNEVEIPDLDGLKSIFKSKASDHEKMSLVKFGPDYLLTASESSKLFHIIKIDQKKPSVIFSQNLAKLGIHRIINLHLNQ